MDNNDYLDKIIDWPEFIYACKYKCTECGGQPIYFEDEYCPYPPCNTSGNNYDEDGKCLKYDNCELRKNESKNHNKHFQCDYWRASIDSKDSLIKFLYRECREPKHNLDRTRKVGFELLTYIDKHYINLKNSSKEERKYDIKTLIRTIQSIENEFIEQYDTKIINTHKDQYADFIASDSDDYCDLINHYWNEYVNYKKGISDNTFEVIKSISFKNLFNCYSYKYEFDNKKTISVILGTNGIGKTTMFKFLDTLLNFDLTYTNIKNKDEKYINVLKNKIDFLSNTIFDEFNISFYLAYDSNPKHNHKHEQECFINVKKNHETNEILISTQNLTSGFSHLMENFSIPIPTNDDDLQKSIESFYFYVFTIRKVLSCTRNKFLFVKTNRFNDLDSIRDELYYNIKNDGKIIDYNDFKEKFVKIANNDFLYDYSHSIYGSIMAVSVAVRYTAIILDIKIDGMASSLNPVIDSLDDVEPFIVIYKSNAKYYDLIRKYFGNLENHIFNLLKIEDDNDDCNNNRDKYRIVNESVEKLGQLLSNIDLFNNYLSLFYNENRKDRKKISYDSEKNILIIKNVGNDDDDILNTKDESKEIELNMLSSGEYNLMMILSYLIFKSKPGSIILIDEPEVSLHIAWQQMILDIILDYSNTHNNGKSKKLQFIIASHSPFITSGHGNLLVGRENI